MTKRDFQSAIEAYGKRHRLPSGTLQSRAWHYLTRCRTCSELRDAIEEFIAQHRLSPTTFGLWAMDDSRFVFDLRRGRSCFHTTFERVCLFMAAHETKLEAKRLMNLNQE